MPVTHCVRARGRETWDANFQVANKQTRQSISRAKKLVLSKDALCIIRAGGKCVCDLILCIWNDWIGTRRIFCATESEITLTHTHLVTQNAYTVWQPGQLARVQRWYNPLMCSMEHFFMKQVMKMRRPICFVSALALASPTYSSADSIHWSPPTPHTESS